MRCGVRGLGGAAILSMVMVTVARAGGFVLSAELPSREIVERVKGAALVVHVVGCQGPGATIAVRAEGLVDGQRRSIALKPVRLEGETFDSFAIRREWPAGGTWALAITATSPERVYDGKPHRLTTSGVVEIGSAGAIVPARTQPETGRKAVEIRHVQAGSLAREVEQSLKRPSADRQAGTKTAGR